MKVKRVFHVSAVLGSSLGEAEKITSVLHLDSSLWLQGWEQESWSLSPYESEVVTFRIDMFQCTRVI